MRLPGRSSRPRWWTCCPGRLAARPWRRSRPSSSGPGKTPGWWRPAPGASGAGPSGCGRPNKDCPRWRPAGRATTPSCPGSAGPMRPWPRQQRALSVPVSPTSCAFVRPKRARRPMPPSRPTSTWPGDARRAEALAHNEASAAKSLELEASARAAQARMVQRREAMTAGMAPDGIRAIDAARDAEIEHARALEATGPPGLPGPAAPAGLGPRPRQGRARPRVLYGPGQVYYRALVASERRPRAEREASWPAVTVPGN